MGFFQARLQERSGSAMRAAVLTAPLFALQHVALVVGNSGLLAVLLMLMLIVLAIPFRAVTAWTYNRTGSLFIVGFIHAAGNAAAAGSGRAFSSASTPARTSSASRTFSHSPSSASS